MADNMRVATCGDCIHADVCVRTLQKFRRDNPAYCKSFKGKDKYVEVVRCRDCKHYSFIPALDNAPRCTKLCVLHSQAYGPKPDDYCSMGERSEGE